MKIFILTSLLLSLISCEAPITVNTPNGGAGVDTPATPPADEARPLLLTNFQAASLVIGQPDFISRATGVNDHGLSGMYGNPTIAGGVLYLPDADSNRILGFSSFPTSNGASANFVLGQTDFVTATSGTANNKFNNPNTVREHAGKFYVLDWENSRLLIYNSKPTTTGAAADIVVGWPNFSTPSTDCTASAMSMPEDFIIVGNKLLISDSNNNRVLIWNSLPTANGMVTPDLVLGQANFTSCMYNLGGPNPTANSFKYPSGIWSDGTKLAVADTSNNRVLIWNTFPTINQQPADVVLGQANMTSAVSSISDKNLDFPYFLTSNGIQLFVADTDNNRVLVWNDFSAGLSNFAPADTVLGQNSFLLNRYNDDDQNGVSEAAPSARTLNSPTGLYVDDERLIIADDQNNRYLIFEGQ